MIQKIDAIVAVAGWEDRFLDGIRRDFESHLPSELYLVRFDEFSDQTHNQRTQLAELADSKQVRVVEVVVNRNPVQLWSVIRATFKPTWWAQRSVLVDITTMPREVIWWVFSSLRSVGSRVHYVYHKPLSYNPEWLTRDTDQPRLVYQHSGVSEFGRDTCLALISGFDIDRSAQLIQFFEPRHVVIGLQLGTQFKNQSRNVQPTKLRLGRNVNVEFFELNSFAQDHGFSAIDSALKPYFGNYNIVAASLGPKPSAVALYRLHLKHPDIALSYAPSRQFNQEYSVGITGDAITGVLDN